MRRLTYKRGRGILVDNNIEYDLLNGVCYQDCVDKLGSLEDIEKELGIDLIKFLRECKYVLEHSNLTTGKTSKGTVIETDFGYVEQFIDGIKKALTREELEK